MISVEIMNHCHESIIITSIKENVKTTKEKRFIVIPNKIEQFCVVGRIYGAGLFLWFDDSWCFAKKENDFF